MSACAMQVIVPVYRALPVLQRLVEGLRRRPELEIHVVHCHSDISRERTVAAGNVTVHYLAQPRQRLVPNMWTGVGKVARRLAAIRPAARGVLDAPLLRVTVQPDKTNNMQKPSQVMVDKAMTVKRDKLGEAFGSAGDETMLEVGRCLAVFLGIAR